MNTNEQMGEVEFGNGLLGINGDWQDFVITLIIRVDKIMTHPPKWQVSPYSFLELGCDPEIS
jgi:hypothetical protein